MGGCATREQKVERAKDNVEQARDDLDQAKHEYLAEVESFRKEKLAETESNQKKIEELKDEVAIMKYEMKAVYHKKIEILEKKNNDLKVRLTEFKEDEKDNWASFKTEFSHDMNELGKALKDFFVKSE